jgi:hypothetical protein
MKHLLLIAAIAMANLSFAKTETVSFDCKGNHFTESTLFGGAIEGDCKTNLVENNLELTYDIDTFGIGFGASTHGKRTLKLELSPRMLMKLVREGQLDLLSCNGGSVEIGWIGGVQYSKVCARENKGDLDKACITFKGGLLYSGLGVELGARCNTFELRSI